MKVYLENNLSYIFNILHYLPATVMIKKNGKPVTDGIYNKKDRLYKRNNTLTQGALTFT